MTAPGASRACNANSLRKLLSTTALGAMVGIVLAGQPALAQAVMVDGVVQDLSSTLTTGVDESAVMVTNGGHLTGTNADFYLEGVSTLITDFSACGQAADPAMRCVVVIDNGSSADLTSSIISHEVVADGFTTGLWVGNQSSLLGEGVGVSADGYGVVVTLGSTVTINNSNSLSGIYTSGDNAHAVLVQSVPTGGTVVDAPTRFNYSGTFTTGGANAVGLLVNSLASDGTNTLTANQSASAGLQAVAIATIGTGGHGISAVGTYSLVEGNDVIIWTEGDGADGVRVNGGAEADFIDLAVQTLGEGAYGLLAVNSPLLIAADGLSSRIDAQYATIVTTGRDSHAVNAGLEGEIALADSIVMTAGDNASGIYSSSGGIVTLDNVEVITGIDLGPVGTSPVWVPVDGSGAAVTNPADYITSGATDAHGLHVIDGGTIIANDSDIRTMGASSAAIYATTENAGINTVEVNGGTLVSDLGDLIRVDDAALQVSLNAVTQTINGSGYVINAVNDSGVDATFSDTRGLVGDVYADGTSTVVVSLENNAQLQGASLGAYNWNVDATSRWLVTGDSVVRNNTANAGLIAFTAPAGGVFKTLTTQNYDGNSGLLSINTYLGDDASPTDVLVVLGDTSGVTSVIVNNAGGLGAQTIADGILVIQVDGNSDGVFGLAAPVIAGAYRYDLFQGGIADPLDGDWYLRSAAFNPSTSDYETYPQVLLALNGLPTFQQRVGNRYWYQQAAPAETIFCKDPERNFRCELSQDQSNYYADAGSAAHIDDSAIWARVEASHGHFEPEVTTVGAQYDLNLFKIQAGVDGLLVETDNGKLIGGITAHYGNARADVWSPVDSGAIDSTGYGLGATLTWMGESGFYLDSQAQVSWYDSNLSSASLGSLVEGNKGMGYSASIEAGQKLALGDHWSITPQAQLIYSRVDFDRFTDMYGATVSLDDGDSLRGRLGVATEYQNSWKGERGDVQRLHLHGIANVHYEFLEGTQVDVSGTKFNSRNDRLWGGLGLGATYAWNDDKFALYGEVNVNTSLANFGESYSIGGTAGFRVKW